MTDRTYLAEQRARQHRHDPMAIAAAREALARRANLIRERVPISVVIERVVKLRKTGNALVGLLSIPW